MDKDLQDKLLTLLLPYQPVRIGIFGSYARGENKKKSDLDILVKFKDQIGLLKLVQIEQALSPSLEISVDLILSFTSFAAWLNATIVKTP